MRMKKMMKKRMKRTRMQEKTMFNRSALQSTRTWYHRQAVDLRDERSCVQAPLSHGDQVDNLGSEERRGERGRSERKKERKGKGERAGEERRGKHRGRWWAGVNEE